MIRRAKPQDVDAIVSLAVESVSTVAPISVEINRAAMADNTLFCMQPAHYLYVSEIGGEVVAAVGAAVTPSHCFVKLSCCVLLHYSRAPGEWVRLMKHFSKWVEGRSAIKTAILEVEDSNPKIIRFMDRLGFSRQTTNCMYVRGNK